MVGVGLGVQVAQGVSVGRAVWVGREKFDGGGMGVCVRVVVLVGIRLGVQVAQWVSVGRGVRVGMRVLVEVRTGVEDGIGVSVGTGVPVGTGEFVCVSEGVSVAVHVSEGVREAKIIGRITAPVTINERHAIENKTITNASPKYRHPAALCRLRSGQLALRRLTCRERIPARKAKKAPSKPRIRIMMRPVRNPMGVIIA
jgi:hypothetical protein